MWNYTVAWCVVTEQQAKQPYQKCQEVYTTFTDQQETSAPASGVAGMHVPVMTELYIGDRDWFWSEYHSNNTGVIRSHQLLL